jgi:hypothetical protein
LTVKKRGSPIGPEDFIRMMRPAGPESRTVLLTRQQGSPVAIICLDGGSGADRSPDARASAASATIAGEDVP